MPWLKQLVVGQSLHKSMFDSRPVHVDYVVFHCQYHSTNVLCCSSVTDTRLS